MRCHFPSADETIRRFGVVARRPGDYFDYSNLGYFVAGAAMSRAAGRSLRELLRDEVFLPLGMAHASLGLDSTEARLVAVPRSWVLGPVPPQASAPGATDYASAEGYASVRDLALFGAFHLEAHRRDQRAILSDDAIDSMQHSVLLAGGARSSYALGWWIEENRFGYRSVLAQGGNDRAQAWLRLIPSEGMAVALVVNKGVAFAETATDAALGALLPRYAEGLAAREQERAATQGSARPASTPMPLDSTVVGKWAGKIHTADADIPVSMTITMNGEVRARLGARSDVGSARLTTNGRLFIRIPGDLEAPNPTGKNRETRFYLDPRGERFGGAVSTRPPSVSGLDGTVSYWAEIARQR